MVALESTGIGVAAQCVELQNFTEPMFVFVIMVIAGARPILQFVISIVRVVAQVIPLPNNITIYFTVLSLVPILGSLITKLAAMTLTALILRRIFSPKGFLDH